MKSITQTSKTLASTSKSKKNLKDREKRKSQTGQLDNNNSSNEKVFPAKDARQYAGISSESIYIYAEQSASEHLSEEICNTLTEDINYKLRYIIHDALLKARLSGRNTITSSDIDETFENLNIEKVYGAPTNPIWVPFEEQNLLYLDDTKISLIELSEESNTYSQPGDIVLTKQWFPDQNDVGKAFRNYFTTICQTVVGNDVELRKAALKDLSENPQIGPIVEWFYNFGYLLLSKDITYDCLTLSALELIETLENSPMGSSNVSTKQLKLLVRLILQRLLMSKTTEEVLKPMCAVLATLCLRQPLRQLVIAKINQKITSICQDFALCILMIVNSLGIEAVVEVFVPNMDYFLTRVVQNKEPELTYAVLGIYNLICKAELNVSVIHYSFQETFDSLLPGWLVMFWKPMYFKIVPEKDEMNFINVKKQLVKTRRKVDCNIRKGNSKNSIEDVFELPSLGCKVRKKLEEFRMGTKHYKKETRITIGKTSLLLSVLKFNNKFKIKTKCCDHSLLAYNI